MDIKFFMDKGVLDLSSQKISFQEGNSRLNDKNLTKFTFPFEVYLDEYLISILGDYISHESLSLVKIIPGTLLFEGSIHTAKLDIEYIEGNKLYGQIDFGFENIPNYDKKLKDLPLEKFSVQDIHTYAIDICKKKYPETNFNFPRIHTKKYSPSEIMWDAFEGYYNHTVLQNGELSMARNVFPTAENNWTIDNVNIIHPCPHILYLLKVGFQDAGFVLDGDILTDAQLMNRWVFSGGQYFKNKWILRKDVLAIKRKNYRSRDDYQYQGRPYANLKYIERFTIKDIDNYRLDFHFSPYDASKILHLFVRVNGVNTTVVTYNESGDFVKSLTLQTTFPNTPVEIEFMCRREMGSGISGGFSGPRIPASAQDERDILLVKLRSQEAYESDNTQDAEEYKVVVNENRVDLTRAVPNMTFGELVGVIQNWFNYDVSIVGSTVYMNRVSPLTKPTVKDFRQYEVLAPKRTLLSEKSFLLKFVELEGMKMNSVFYDKKGVVLNGKEDKNTSTIEINGYPMPVGKAKENHTPTAQVKKDSDTVLALVYYDGLVDGINNAQAPPDCQFPELFSARWESWLKQRIHSEQYNWKFTATVAEMSQFRISDYLFCYQKEHIIKSWTKDIVSPGVYEVEVTTETVM